MNWRSRGTFWALVATVLALVSVPSVEWVSALREYSRFTGDWEPSPLKPSRTSFTPRDNRASAEEAVLRPVEFRHKARKAKSVELVGDFNAWTPGLLKMRRAGDGTWLLVVPMRAGRHKYLFLVDGEPQVDAAAQTADGPEGRRVSVKDIP